MIGIEQIVRNGRTGDGSIIYLSEDIDFRPFAFVLNVKQLIDEERIEIAPGYMLRRAQKSEIGYIKEFLKKRFGTESSTAIWENRPIASGEEPKLPKTLALFCNRIRQRRSEPRSAQGCTYSGPRRP
jgi:hypothetical protein